MADLGGGDLVAERAQFFFDLVGKCVDGALVDGTSLGGRGNTGDDLGPVERHAVSAALDHHQRDLFQTLTCGEAIATQRALPAATDRRTFFSRTRIDDLGVIGRADGAMHAPTVVRRLVCQEAYGRRIS